VIVIPQNIFGLSNKKERNARGICHIWESGGKPAGKRPLGRHNRV